MLLASDAIETYESFSTSVLEVHGVGMVMTPPFQVHL